MSRPRTQSRATPPAVRPAPKPRPQSPALPPADWREHPLPMATVTLIASVLYRPALNGPFVYDDPNAVSQSLLIREVFPLYRFLVLCTRPLTDFSYAVNYSISGLDTWSYHLTNTLLHAANGLLLYGIAWMTFGTAPLARRYGAVRRNLAWAAAALFVAHPLASEAVAYVSSRSEVLVAFCMLLALFCFIVGASSRRRAVQRAAGVGVFLATSAALGSKEIA